MKLSLMVFVVAMAVNTVCLVVMYLLQWADRSLPPRGSIFPGTRQRFLHAEDYWVLTYGDFLALPLIANSFAHLVAGGFVSNCQWSLFAAIVAADSIGWLVMFLGKDHRSDWCYPGIGRVSLAGMWHCLYHGLCVAMAFLSLWGAFTGNLCGPVHYLFWVGIVSYIALFVVDTRVGNFDPLKKVE